MKSPHLDRCWLYQKYIVEGLSTYDIGKIVCRDPKGVYTQLRRFGIPTRPRGLNLKGSDNYLKMSGGVSPWKGMRHTEETRAKLRVIASQPKPHLRGSGNAMYGRTGTANPNYKHGRCPERQSEYASAEWRAVLRALRRRDGRCCKRCGQTKHGYKTIHAHHVQSWGEAVELRFDLSNIVTLCNECHSWVHSRQNVHREFLSPSL